MTWKTHAFFFLFYSGIFVTLMFISYHDEVSLFDNDQVSLINENQLLTFIPSSHVDTANKQPSPPIPPLSLLSPANPNQSASSSPSDSKYHPYEPPLMDRELFDKTQNWFFEHFGYFCNGCDFDVIKQFFALLCPSTKHVMNIFIVGANDGQSVFNFFVIDSCMLHYRKLLIHAFEAVPQLYDKLLKKNVNDRWTKNSIIW